MRARSLSFPTTTRSSPAKGDLLLSMALPDFIRPCSNIRLSFCRESARFQFGASLEDEQMKDRVVSRGNGASQIGLGRVWPCGQLSGVLEQFLVQFHPALGPGR